MSRLIAFAPLLFQLTFPVMTVNGWVIIESPGHTRTMLIDKENDGDYHVDVAPIMEATAVRVIATPETVELAPYAFQRAPRAPLPSYADRDPPISPRAPPWRPPLS